MIPTFGREFTKIFFAQSIDEMAQKVEVKELHNNDGLIAFQSSQRKTFSFPARCFCEFLLQS